MMSNVRVTLLDAGFVSVVSDRTSMVTLALLAFFGATRLMEKRKDRASLGRRSPSAQRTGRDVVSHVPSVA